jgi:hypothetical protein
MSLLYQLLTAPIFWAFWTAIFTGLIVWVAYIQLKRINTATRADFIDRFKKDFFKESTRDIMAIIQYEALIFKVRDI